MSVNQASHRLSDASSLHPPGHKFYFWLIAGAMSMAAGEYVSVHSQADTEQADLALERTELKLDAPGEHRETLGNLRRSRPRSCARQKGRRSTEQRHEWRQPEQIGRHRLILTRSNSLAIIHLPPTRQKYRESLDGLAAPLLGVAAFFQDCLILDRILADEHKIIVS